MSRSSGLPRSLSFAELDPKLLLENGNYLYSVTLDGKPAVLKLYYGSRSRGSYVSRSLANLVVANRTSVLPRSRKKMEQDCVELWRACGFRVFGIYEDVQVTDLPPGGYTVFEYVEAPTFVEYFRDSLIPLEQRRALWRRFLPVWHHRHRLALERREPRLVHENGDLKHVMILADDFLFFDMEICFRSRNRVKPVVAREILCYLKSMGRTVGAEEFELFLADTLAYYPDPELLHYTWNFAFEDTNRLHRWGRALERHYRAGARKPFSKYNIALHIHKATQIGAESSRHG